MVLISTGMLSATDNVVKAQSTGGVTGQGTPPISFVCGANVNFAKRQIIKNVQQLTD